MFMLRGNNRHTPISCSTHPYCEFPRVPVLRPDSAGAPPHTSGNLSAIFQHSISRSSIHCVSLSFSQAASVYTLFFGTASFFLSISMQLVVYISRIHALVQVHPKKIPHVMGSGV